jgi:hypothetical protein
MKTSAAVKLLKQLELYRNELVSYEGELVPKSVSILVTMLESETDPDDRYGLYRHVLLECHLADKTSAAVKFAQARYDEFHDVTSLMAYSTALVENGELEAGVSRAREALDLANREQALVNYAAAHLVRQSIKTASIDIVNQALHALVSSTEVSRKEDCALEIDWADAAEALGADRGMISWARSAAERR